jgi:hypothetical protein
MLCYWLDTQHAVALLAKQSQTCEQPEHSHCTDSHTKRAHVGPNTAERVVSVATKLLFPSSGHPLWLELRNREVLPILGYYVE